jgi:SAM-dependent methyltransferase
VGVEQEPRALLEFYAGMDESRRLTYREGRVEFLRTQALVRAAIAPGSRILDVGGADGAHTAWLLSDGHSVEILDRVPSHVERALARGFTARTGDARSLPYANASFDVVLLLGPLYHLIDASDRATALSEARRVLRPGGLLAAAGISRIAVALDYLRKRRLDQEAEVMTARIVANGHDDTGFGAGVFYFHLAAELESEVTAASRGGGSRVAPRGSDVPAR